MIPENLKNQLEKYQETYYEFSGRTSDAARQLSFAGIAIIWLFKIDGKNGLEIPDAFLFPLILLAASLTLDLFQYLLASAVWGRHQYLLEKNLLSGKITTEKGCEPISRYKLPQNICFWPKIAFVIWAYFLIGKHLYHLWDISKVLTQGATN